MALYVLNINDVNLRIYRDTELLLDEPGIALIGEQTNSFGETARKQIKQHPRQVNYTYWHRMNQDPLGFTGPLTHNHADLLYQQLGELVKRAGINDRDEFVIVVRSNTSNEQLSLLLGVCQECKIRVSGLVDVSAALLSMQSAFHNNLVLDIGLQSLTVAEIAVVENGKHQSVQKTGYSELSELGLLPLMDAWLAIIADRFVSDVRFDPLRIADTEQQVFDQVYDWLIHPDRPDTLNIEVQYETITRSIEINESVLVNKAARRYDLVQNKFGSPQCIWLTETSSLLPGFRKALTSAGHSVTNIESENIHHAIHKQLNYIVQESGPIQFVTALKTTSEVKRNNLDKQPDKQHAPTHILYRGLTVQLNSVQNRKFDRESFKTSAVELPGGEKDYPISLLTGSSGLKIDIPTESGWLLNNETLHANQEIFAGDRLSLGQEQLEFIRVEDGT